MTNDLYMVGSGNNTLVAFDIRSLTFTSMMGRNWIFRGTNSLLRRKRWLTVMLLVAASGGTVAKYSTDFVSRKSFLSPED